MIIAIYGPAASGKSTVAIGGGPPAESQSEEWEIPGATKTLTVS